MAACNACPATSWRTPTYTVPAAPSAPTGVGWLRGRCPGSPTATRIVNCRALVVSVIDRLGAVTYEGTPTRSLLARSGCHLISKPMSWRWPPRTSLISPRRRRQIWPLTGSWRPVAAGRKESAAIVCVLVQAHGATLALIEARRRRLVLARAIHPSRFAERRRAGRGPWRCSFRSGTAPLPGRAARRTPGPHGAGLSLLGAVSEDLTSPPRSQFSMVSPAVLHDRSGVGDFNGSVGTGLCDLLEIEVPIVLAPFGPWDEVELAAAVCEAGALGSVGTAVRSVTELRQQWQRLRELTDRPFAINHTGRPFNAEAFEATLEFGPAAISFHMGVPVELISAAHERGISGCRPSATSRRARAAIDAGADVIVAQGTEAGGNAGWVTTMVLVPAVVDVAGDGPGRRRRRHRRRPRDRCRLGPRRPGGEPRDPVPGHDRDDDRRGLEGPDRGRIGRSTPSRCLTPSGSCLRSPCRRPACRSLPARCGQRSSTSSSRIPPASIPPRSAPNCWPPSARRRPRTPPLRRAVRPTHPRHRASRRARRPPRRRQRRRGQARQRTPSSSGSD